ncbi:phosphate/phosphite/phosphonate ABC transporter substrate-binding protein [Pontibacterium granulatum]|uniref:phosphate/phosphite/phosphonate ABC transporter substrate-binding protein n=1 Tax=Pontibacterium granulatum TaxID=2036029 RepID=UPI00249C5068|nr:phosphate/phosphite/phosphonate ABC transporter substrate-binding protein [Pontibacterium granulatum]MDI3324600.1 phosphate/phosphite/phosphonate ABC transporter substrate-binding protein [Pontibacterium granulatum]
MLVPTQGVAKDVFSFAVVPQYSAGDTFRVWQPIIRQLNGALPFRLALETAPDISSFEDLCEDGQFDFAFVNPYHLLRLHENRGYEPLLSDRSGRINGVLVTRREGGVSEVAQLDHQSVAFPSPNSLGASMMLRRDLREQFQLSIKPRYVKSHSSVYLNVALGVTAAGGGVQKTLAQQPQHIRDQLQVIHRTGEMPSHPVVVHPRVPLEVRQALKDVMLALAQTEKFQTLLRNVPVYQLGPASFSDYQPLLQLGLDAYYEEQR